MDVHVLALWSLDDKYPTLKIYFSELNLDSHEYIPVAYITMHCII